MATPVPDRSGAPRKGKTPKLANPKTCLHGYATKEERDNSATTGCYRCKKHLNDISNNITKMMFG
jgi:hypothetical protein